MPAPRSAQPVLDDAARRSGVSGRAASFIDPHTLMRIKSLQLRAKVRIDYYAAATTRPLEPALFDFLRARLHAGKQFRASRRQAKGLHKPAGASCRHVSAATMTNAGNPPVPRDHAAVTFAGISR